MGFALNIAAAMTAFLAAIFWFLSAWGKVPPMLTYCGGAPDNDPFYQAVKFSATMNKWAAGFSGVSALCVAITLFIGK